MPTIQSVSPLEGTDKLRELVLYVCTASEGDESFGSVKLNKLLFYSDFLSYLQHGIPITGQEYQSRGRNTRNWRKALHHALCFRFLMTCKRSGSLRLPSGAISDGRRRSH